MTDELGRLTSAEIESLKEWLKLDSQGEGSSPRACEIYRSLPSDVRLGLLFPVTRKEWARFLVGDYDANF